VLTVCIICYMYLSMISICSCIAFPMIMVTFGGEVAVADMVNEWKPYLIQGININYTRAPYPRPSKRKSRNQELQAMSCL
jgi:hypothetical protein